MPRTARKKSKSGYYHIVLRGINKQDLFLDDEDKEVFLNRIKLVKEKTQFKMIAFCLMTNHVHLVLKENKELGKDIKNILSSYVFWYNSKYERVGHLFQERFKSESIENDEYLLCCVRYIFQNPLKANMCENIWEYKWSSANLLLKEITSNIDDKIIKDILQGQTKIFMESIEPKMFMEWESKVKYTDEKFKEKICKILKIENIYDMQQLAKDSREQALKTIMQIEEANILQVSRITGVPYHFIRYLK